MNNVHQMFLLWISVLCSVGGAAVLLVSTSDSIDVPAHIVTGAWAFLGFGALASLFAAATGAIITQIQASTGMPVGATVLDDDQ